MQKNIFLCLSLFLCLFVFQNCKHRAEPVPPVAINPCDTAKLPNADFKIIQRMDNFAFSDQLKKLWKDMDVDTIITQSNKYGPNTIFFIANERYATKYLWDFGQTYPITTSDHYENRFVQNTWSNTSLQISKKHVLWEKCFLNTDTIFTKSRSFYVLGDWSKSKVFGTFSGSFSNNPWEIKTLKISTEIYNNLPRNLKLEGIYSQSTCENFSTSEYNFSYKQLTFNLYRASSCNLSMGGFAKIYGINNDSLIVQYQKTYDSNAPIITFKGKRIN